MMRYLHVCTPTENGVFIAGSHRVRARIDILWSCSLTCWRWYVERSGCSYHHDEREAKALQRCRFQVRISGRLSLVETEGFSGGREEERTSDDPLPIWRASALWLLRCHKPKRSDLLPMWSSWSSGFFYWVRNDGKRCFTLGYETENIRQICLMKYKAGQVTTRQEILYSANEAYF